MTAPTIGQQVFYTAERRVFDDPKAEGVFLRLPALITNVLNGTTVSLVAFTSDNRIFGSGQFTKGFKIVNYSETKEPGTWCTNG